MSFRAADLSVLAYANGFTHWHYRTADTLADILGASYFQAAAEMLRAGDQVSINLIADGAIHLAQLAVTKIASDGAVELALIGASTPPIAFRRAA